MCFECVDICQFENIVFWYCKDCKTKYDAR